MSEPTQAVEQPVLPPSALNFKLSAPEILNQLRTYSEQAEKTLSQLQANIESGNNQIKEWQRMQLMIVGQKQLVADLVNKMVDTTPQAPETTKS